MSEIRFTDLTLSEPVLAALTEMGYEHPTPVQETSIPMATTGQDLMVQSQTGTGKTAAFGIPLIETLTADKGIKGLILCPTRELARQVAEELSRLGKFKQVRTAAVYGGGSLDKQVAEMRFAQIVAGTPGRVLDHLKRKNISFKGVQALVLDEADEMLSMGFAQELEQIMRYIPVDRQTLLFSATIPPDVKRYATKYMRDPEFLSLIEENVAADEVTHQYFMVSGVGRSRDLVRIIELEEPASAIIFTNTRKDCEVVARALKRSGYDAEYLNSDLSQRDRERVMRRMKDKDLRFLVATDIAARGIDISQLSHVINYTLPESPEVYIHRTGRTGRAGNKGTALSLIGPREIGVYYYLKRIYEVSLEERTLPSATEIDLRRNERKTKELVDTLKQSIPADKLGKEGRSQAAYLLERDDAVELVQILLTHFHRRGKASTGSEQSFGGVLKDVPKPERIAPGSKAASIEGIASRVATIRGEYRGLPGTGGQTASSKPTAPAKSDSQAAAQPAETEKKEAKASRPKRTGSAPGAKPSLKDKVRARAGRTNSESKSDEAVVETKASDSEPADMNQSSEKKPRQSRKGTPERPVSTNKSAEKTTRTAARVDAVAKKLIEKRVRQKQSTSEPTNAVSEDAKTETTQANSATQEKSQSGSQLLDKVRSKLRSRTAKPGAQPAVSEPPKAQGTTEKSEAHSTRSRRRPRAPLPPLEPGIVRLYINIGLRDDLDDEGLRDELSELAGLYPDDILEIDLRPRHAYVLVEEEFTEDVIAAVDGARLSGKRIRIEVAREN